MTTHQPVHEALHPRDVVLGRSTHVSRILPHKVRRMVGAWCFLDLFGPDDIKTIGGMWVPPHPHTGLQTVTWLFEGLGRHTDSLGSDQLIRPGQLNVMTAGHGICHAEVSPEDAPRILHGVQLWVALPDPDRDTATPDFTHLEDLPTFSDAGAHVTVMVGELAGRRSGAPTYSPLVAAEVRLSAGSHVVLPAVADFEYSVLAVGAPVMAGKGRVEPQVMAYLGAGGSELDLSAPEEDAIALVLGGAPFEEEILMWWNFIGRSHDEVVEQRAEWNGTGVDFEPSRYGAVRGFPGDRLLAPPMPTTRLRPRGRVA